MASKSDLANHLLASPGRPARLHRPLLVGKDPLAVLEGQAAERYPLFGEADIIVESGESAHGVTVDRHRRALAAAARMAEKAQP